MSRTFWPPRAHTTFLATFLIFSHSCIFIKITKKAKKEKKAEERSGKKNKNENCNAKNETEICGNVERQTDRTTVRSRAWKIAAISVPGGQPTKQRTNELTNQPSQTPNRSPTRMWTCVSKKYVTPIFCVHLSYLFFLRFFFLGSHLLRHFLNVAKAGRVMCGLQKEREEREERL